MLNRRIRKSAIESIVSQIEEKGEKTHTSKLTEQYHAVLPEYSIDVIIPKSKGKLPIIEISEMAKDSGGVPDGWDHIYDDVKIHYRGNVDGLISVEFEGNRTGFVICGNSLIHSEKYHNLTQTEKEAFDNTLLLSKYELRKLANKNSS